MLTYKEREILQYIIDFKKTNYISPTISEIAENLYTSRTWVRECLYTLELGGYIRYDCHRMRSIVVLKFDVPKIS